MPLRSLTFPTTLQPDDALAINARYAFDAPDRQSIDQQVRTLQGFAARGFLNGTVATYVQLVTTDATIGDVVCSANGLNSKPTVTIATPSALSTAGVIFGVVLENASAGGKALVAIGGVVGPEITGLAASDPGWVRVTSAGRCEKVATLSTGDALVGWVDNGGYLRLILLPALEGAPTDPAFVIDTDTSIASLPNAVLVRALAAELAFYRRLGVPITVTREDAAGSSEEGFAVHRTTTSNVAGTVGTAVESSFYLPDSVPAQRRSTRFRSEWISATAISPRAKFVLSLLTTDGEHDRLVITDTGLVQADGGYDTQTAVVLPLGYSTATAVRMANTKALVWRNAANGADLNGIKFDASDNLVAGQDSGMGDIEVRVPTGQAVKVYVNNALVAQVDGTNGVLSDNFDTLTNGGTLILGGGRAAAITVNVGGVPATFGDSAIFNAPIKLAQHTVADLTVGSPPPLNPADWSGYSVLCTNQTGGQGICTSNGTNWISDRTGVTVT